MNASNANRDSKPKNFASDFSRPSALPTAALFQRSQANPFLDLTSDEYLDSIKDEWTRRVDAEIETLVDGMSDLVTIASVC